LACFRGGRFGILSFYPSTGYQQRDGERHPPAYFNNPWWIAGHNFLHSPTALIIYAILLWRFVDKVGSRGHGWLSFVFGCMVHSVIDILTHYDDGPVLFFPFDWHTRFYSPVSYWDKAHYASQFVYFEVGLNLVLLGYLFLPKLINRIKNRLA
jgi:hypothetical protein